jgi:prepilin-type processing-associated H-X9-DG protein
MGTSTGGGEAVKSHRPTSGLCSSATGGQYDSEVSSATTLYAVPVSVAKAVTTGNDQIHLNYVQWDRHSKGSNYLFADGHSERKSVEETLDPKKFLWGKKAYTDPQVTEILGADGTPIQ